MPPVVILSGLLRDEAESVAGAFTQRGLRERQRREHGDWAALLLTN
jgi:ribosomal protein L11 methylase PrmA